jgi:GAF domain-containing protein
MAEEQKSESGGEVPAGVERSIQEALEIAREALGMDAGYVAEFTEDEQVYRGLAGDAGSFEMREDEGFPIEGTYCRRMVTGEIPNVVADSAANEAVRDLAITKLGEIGSYVGVPITFSDGRIYGTVCTISHDARSDLSERDVLVLKAIAKLMGSELEREAVSDENRKLTGRVAELEAQIEELQAAVQAAEATGSDDFVDVRGWRPD